MDFTKTIINAIKIWVNKQLSFIENKISDLEDRPSAFIQPEEPNEAPDGTLWIDTDEDSISGVGSNTAESLTFTGVVEATYNGLSPVTVNIPKVTVNGVTSDENGNIEIEVGSEQVQTDWNQNDSTQPDYIKNRTHWVEGSTYHTLNDNFIPETIARTSAVEEIKTLVGETPVSEQIEAAIAEIPEVEIPEQVQSDWEQNDPSASDYIKNRLCYKQLEENADLIPKMWRRYSAFDSTGCYAAEIDTTSLPIIGETYEVRAGSDSTLNLVCKQYGDSYTYCGNLSMYDNTLENTGETVLVLFYNNKNRAIIFSTISSDSSYSYVSGKTCIYYSLDEKFIPDTIARLSDIPEVSSAHIANIAEIGLLTYDMVINNALIIVHDFRIGHNEEQYPMIIIPHGEEEDAELVGGSSKRKKYYAIDRLGTFYEGYVMSLNNSGAMNVYYPLIDESRIPDTIARMSDIPAGEWQYEEELWPELPMNFDIADIDGFIVAGMNLGQGVINENQTYTFVLDGVSYETDSYIINSEKIVGNPSMMPGASELGYEDNGLPFWASFTTLEDNNPNDILNVFLQGDTEETHTIGVSATNFILKQLDEKYIPNTIARVSDIPEVPEINYPVTSVNGQTGDVQIEIPSTYTKEEIDNMEFITVDEIDAICGQTIQVASATNGTF